MNMKQLKGQQSGFTLIELVVVIVILGILAATAIPRFANLSSDARMAKMNAALGAMKSASSLVHAQWLVAGADDTVTTVTMEGTTVKVLHGYPDSAAGGMDVAAGLLTDYQYAGATGTVTPDAAHASCTVVYTAPAAANTEPTYDNSGVIAANC